MIIISMKVDIIIYPILNQLKKIILFIFFLIQLSTIGQVTLLSPTGDGGFETGTTAAANGWTATVGTATQNQWIVGSAYAYGGSRGAYITNATSTAPNSYTNSAARVSHLYRNFTLPTNTATATLSFYWKGTGESCCDYYFCASFYKISMCIS